MTTVQDEYEDGWFHEKTRSFVPDSRWASEMTDEQIKGWGWIRARSRNHIVLIEETD